MKTIFTLALIISGMFAQGSGSFKLIEVNPSHGNEAFIWADSSKAVYGAGELSGFVDLNGKLFFTARNSENNDELWSTDGTSENAALVKDINLNGSASIGNIVKLGNRILFMASDNGTDFDLWSSDGLSSGTVKVADMNQSSNTALQPQNMALLGNRLIFCSETQLMSTDGTAGGTNPMMAITQYAQGFGYCSLNDFVYFILPDALWQPEIWRTDGTPVGTTKVLELVSSPQHISSINEMVSFNGKIYLSAAASGSGSDLYTFDGNLNGQLQKISLTQTGNSYPSQLTLFNDALYFSASNNSSANVYRITTDVPTPEALIPNAGLSWLSNLTFINHSIYFLSEDQQHIHRIALSNSAHTITFLNGHYMPWYFSNAGGMMVGNNGKVFFAAYDSTSNNQIFFEGDESLENINAVMPEGADTYHPFNYFLSCGMADVFDFRMWGDKVIVPANFNSAGRELWIFEANGTSSNVKEKGNEIAISVFPNPALGELFIKASNPAYCAEQLFITNAMGEIMLKTSFTGGITSVDITNLAAGNYFATLHENGKAIGTRKFVIAK